MNPPKLDVGRGRIQAAAGVVVLAMLSTLASTLVAPRAMGQCTLSSAVNFGAGNAPGAPIPTSGSAFRSGYENDVPVYTTSSGARRLLLMFNYGYGVMDLSNPGNPSALTYENMLSDIPPRGDGQSYITSMGVAPDGARAVFSLGSQATPFKAAVGNGTSQAFFLKGDFSAGVATGGTVVQKTGDGRYIAYALISSRLVAANITTLPTGPLTAGSIQSEATNFPGGTASTLQLAGNYLSYLSGTSVLILDASNPGSSPPNITPGFTQTKLSLADFGRSSGSPVTLATALDPANSSALYVLVEFAGSGYSLMRVQGSTKTLIGSFPIPTVLGETWDSGYTSALITGGSNVYVFMWLTRTSPSPLFRLYSTTVSSFGSTPGATDFDPAVYAFFATGHLMRGFASSDGTVNAYMGMSATAYALTLSCHSTSSPAAADMTVTSGATQLADGATVFLGDTITIKPVVNPPAAVKPITSWDFDFDFHAGVASEDNGPSATPRLRAPDNSALGGGSTPPTTVTLVGPCDPNVAGTTPGTGAGCWNSVMQNSSFAGGSPDFTGTELAGATKPLRFAFEASNALGSAGAKVFSLNWTVPAARLLSSQILLGNAISSGADGHPAASGFKWYFGSTAGLLVPPAGEPMTQDTSCTGATCTHQFPGKGTFNVWLTVPYANGYTTPDCASPCVATGALKVTVTDVVLAFTAPAQVSTSQANFSVVNSSTVSSSVTKVGNGYTYCVKPASQTCQDSEYADLLANGTGPIPTPGLGNYWLRIRFNYTIAGAAQLPAQWTPSASGVSDATAWPFNVSSLVPEIRFNCTPGFGCTDVGSIIVFATDVFTAYAYVNGGQDNSTSISWSASGASQGNGSTQNPVTLSYSTAGTYTLTLNGYGVPKTAIVTVKARVNPPPALSVSASANPTSANTGTSITFSCSASGGTPGYSYSWSGAVSGSTTSVSASFSNAGNYSATCTVTDAASHTASATASVSITAPGGGGGNVEIRFNCTPGFGCTDVNRISAYTNDVFTAYAYLNGGQDNSTSISWSAPGASQGNGSTQNGQTFSYSTVGTYTLTLNGYGTPHTATITVSQKPGGGGGGGGPTCTDVDFKILDGGSGLQIPPNFVGVIVVNANQPLSFAANATTFASYDWDFGDGSAHGSGATAPHTFLSGGTNPTVKLTVPANGTCRAQASHSLSVAGPAGPTGVFTVKYADSSPFLATKVASGKALSFLATDAGDTSTTYTWDFGDGSLPATGQTQTHTYNEPVQTDRTVKLSVTKGTLTGSTQQTFTILPPPEPPKWFVAGVAYLPGSIENTLWQTDFTILNPDPTRPAAFSIAFLDGRNPVDPNNLVWTPSIPLDPQHSVGSSNILALLGQPLGSYGALLVRGDVAPSPPVITSRTFNNGDPKKGTFGLSVPTTQASSGVSPQASAAQQLLIGLRDDDTAYTNIALVNLVSKDWSHAHLAFFDSAGANLGLLNVNVPPFGVAQLTRPLTGGGGLGLPKQDLYSVQVTVEAGGSVYPYATVIDNASTDAIVVTPTVQPFSTYRVPGIVRAAGANGTTWRSRFVLHNPSSAPRKVNIQYSYVPCNAAGCGNRSKTEQDISMAAGETKAWDDFPAAWITGPGSTVSDDVSYGDSFVDVSPSTGDTNVDPLLVLGETLNLQPTGAVGLQLPGFTDVDAVSKTSGARRLALAGLASNDAFRTNVAFFLTSGSSGSFKAHVISDTGVELKSFGWTLGSSGPFKQFSDASLFGDLANKPDRITIIVDSLDGAPVAAYATIIDNTSGDATFVKAQTAP